MRIGATGHMRFHLVDYYQYGLFVTDVQGNNTSIGITTYIWAILVKLD